MNECVDDKAIISLKHNLTVWRKLSYYYTLSVCKRRFFSGQQWTTEAQYYSETIET